MFHRLRERVLRALDENAQAAGVLLEWSTPVPVLELSCRGSNGASLVSPLVPTSSGGIRRARPVEDGD